MSKKKQKFEISKEKSQQLCSEIKTFFLNERNEDIGDLAATIYLDFIIDKIAPEFYNEGLNDAHDYISDRLQDIFGLSK